MGAKAEVGAKSEKLYNPDKESKKIQKDLKCQDVLVDYCPSIQGTPIILKGDNKLHCQHGPHCGDKDPCGNQVAHQKPFVDPAQINAIKEINSIKDQNGKVIGYKSDSPKEEIIIRGNTLDMAPMLTLGRIVKKRGDFTDDDRINNKLAPEIDHFKPWKLEKGCNSFRNASLISNALNNFKRSSWPWDYDGKALKEKLSKSRNVTWNEVKRALGI